jgi:hypothetical protein
MKYVGCKHLHYTELPAGNFSAQFYECKENLSGSMKTDTGLSLHDAA